MFYGVGHGEPSNLQLVPAMVFFYRFVAFPADTVMLIRPLQQTRKPFPPVGFWALHGSTLI
jgi:hypothetical protein